MQTPDKPAPSLLSRIGKIIRLVLIVLGFFVLALYLYAWRGRDRDKEYHMGLAQTVNLTSTTTDQAGNFPIRCTCEGGESRPALTWSNLPPGTKSLVLTMHDYDVPSPAFPLAWLTHWVSYDLPANLASLPEGAKDAPLPAGITGENSMGDRGYAGPCPPFGRHAYPIRIYALDVESLGLGNEANYHEVARAMRPHILAYGLYQGYYQE